MKEPEQPDVETRDISSDAFDAAYDGPKVDEDAPEVSSEDADYTRADEDARTDEAPETETDFA